MQGALECGNKSIGKSASNCERAKAVAIPLVSSCTYYSVAHFSPVAAGPTAAHLQPRALAPPPEVR